MVAAQVRQLYRIPDQADIPFIRVKEIDTPVLVLSAIVSERADYLHLHSGLSPNLQVRSSSGPGWNSLARQSSGDFAHQLRLSERADPRPEGFVDWAL